MAELKIMDVKGKIESRIDELSGGGVSYYRLSRGKIIRTRFSDANFCFCRVKILGNASAFPAFFPCRSKNLLSENSFDLKHMNY